MLFKYFLQIDSFNIQTTLWGQFHYSHFVEMRKLRHRVIEYLVDGH